MTGVAALPLDPSDARWITAMYDITGENPLPRCCERDMYRRPWTVPSTERIAGVRIMSGRIVARVICPECGHWRSADLPHYMVRSIRGVPVVLDKTRGERCEVIGCTNVGVEEHHWAPYHLFGDESYHWPSALLCVEHHRRWHKIVTPDMAQALEEVNT